MHRICGDVGRPFLVGSATLTSLSGWWCVPWLAPFLSPGTLPTYPSWASLCVCACVWWSRVARFPNPGPFFPVVRGFLRLSIVLLLFGSGLSLPFGLFFSRNLLALVPRCLRPPASALSGGVGVREVFCPLVFDHPPKAVFLKGQKIEPFLCHNFLSFKFFAHFGHSQPASPHKPLRKLSCGDATASLLQLVLPPCLSVDRPLVCVSQPGECFRCSGVLAPIGVYQHR